jgi:hypothetical protein
MGHGVNVVAKPREEDTTDGIIIQSAFEKARRFDPLFCFHKHVNRKRTETQEEKQ